MRLRSGGFTALLVFGVLLPAARAFPTAAQIALAFRAMDTTGDTAISRTEWNDASEALFRAHDRNKSGFIEAPETRAAGIAPGIFQFTDADHDGRLSLDEFMTQRRDLFAVADRNRNDSVALVEYELFVVFEAVGWQDGNDNGRMDNTELRHALESLIGKLDRDEDTQLDRSEAGFMQAERFTRFDQNQDGKLTLEELLMGYRGEFEA